MSRSSGLVPSARFLLVGLWLTSACHDGEMLPVDGMAGSRGESASGSGSARPTGGSVDAAAGARSDETDGASDGGTSQNPPSGGPSGSGAKPDRASGGGGSSSGGLSDAGGQGAGDGGYGSGATMAGGGTSSSGGDASSPETGGYDAGGTDAGGYGSGVGGSDYGGRDNGEVGGSDSGGSDSGGSDSGGSDSGGSDSGGTDSGGATAGGTGSGGSDIGPNPGFAFLVGRLPASPRFCWVRAPNGILTDGQWFAVRDALQTWITTWQGNSALSIRWANACQSPGTGGTEEVRILLDDRPSPNTTIDACTQPDRPGPWAVYPSELPAYADCAWNMVLPIAKLAPRTILKVAGHALGYSHSPWGERFKNLACPDVLEGEAFSPFVDYYDEDSVMHPGTSAEEEFFPDPFSDCIYEEEYVREDFGLSAGDRLAIEMLYPKAGAPTLGPSTWILAEALVTFPDASAVPLQNEWIARGANPDWFESYSWLTGDGSSAPILSTELSPVLSLVQGTIYEGGHVFQDPFGDSHSFEFQLRAEEGKHMAVLMTAVH